MKSKLEIGILIDNPLVSSYELSFIIKLKESYYSNISLIIFDEKCISSDTQMSGGGNFIVSVHKGIDRFIFLPKNNYLEKKDLFKYLPDVPVIRLKSMVNNGLKYFHQDDIRKIREFSPDIIIKLSYGLTGDEILDVPELGIWSYKWKNSDSEKNDVTGYYEIPYKKPTTSSDLIILRPQGENCPVISHAIESTCPYSISLNKDKLFGRASFFIPRVAEGIYNYGESHLEILKEKYNQLNDDSNQPVSVPSFTRALKNIWLSTIILLGNIFKKMIFTDPFSWFLLFKICPENDFQNNDYGEFTTIKPSKDKFWADPFVMKKGDKYFLFVEEFIYSKNKGHISVLELDRNGSLLNVQKIIEKPYHISYPFIFEADNAIYMIPETGANRSVDLYRCSEFPCKWDFVKTIMSNINAVDSTLFFYNHKWWLFTVIDQLEGFVEGSPELYLFYSDDFLSDNWISHPLNPVISDVRSARPAGKIFIRNGEVYRPSQDCAGRYGNSFDINRIITLTETDYREEKVIKIKPDWDIKLKGTHTFNFDVDFTVIDAYKFRRRFI